MTSNSSMHQCKPCGTSTSHTPVHTAPVRMLVRIGEVAVFLASLGFLFPHAIGAPETTVECSKCKGRLQIARV